jgi:hypothetical protein
MLMDRFQPTAPDEEGLKPWAMALSTYGRFWLDGREGGVSEKALMEALWNGSQIT